MTNSIKIILCAFSKDSDQPGHPPSLIYVFEVPKKRILLPLLPIDDTDSTGESGRMLRLV